MTRECRTGLDCHKKQRLSVRHPCSRRNSHGRPPTRNTKSPVPKNEARYARSPFGQLIKGTSKAYLPGPLKLIHISSQFGPFRQWVSERATVLMRTPDDSNEGTPETISISSQRRISFGAGPCRGCAWQPSKPSRDAVRARWGLLGPS